MMYCANGDKDIWNGYLNEIRHDVIAKQKQAVPTDRDIELLGRVIYYVKSFAENARSYGLLAVEEVAAGLDVENLPERVLYEAAQLLVDGCSTEYMAEVLSNHYWISQPKEYEATAVYMGIRGVLMVQKGANPYSIQQLICSILPMEIRDKCIEVCRKYETQKRKNREEIAKVYFETDFSRSEGLEVRESLDLLERELSCMTDREIQCLLREVDNNYLVPALIGMRKKARQTIARNMSARLRGMIMEECYRLAEIDNDGIAEGAVYVTEKLKVLQACGEIMDAEERLLYRES